MLQMFVPNRVGVYGSQYTQASQANNDVIENHNDSLCYIYEMKITKSGLKAIDQPTQRCDSSARDPNTSECIATYIENQIGCSLKIHGSSGRAEMKPCTLESELQALKNMTRKLQEASANKIYNMTGCLASCERDEYGQIDSNLRIIKNCHMNYLHLDFKITKGSYKEEEQYIIYDFNTFIGCVGGILGLCNLLAMGLLGCGILTLHNELANLLGRFKGSTK